MTDPLSLDDYRRLGGLRGLTRALSLGPNATVEEVVASGLRGRGGAGFPTGIKWRTAWGRSGQKYVVCNADEGDSGTFADRMLMEGDPFLLIEGMAIAAVSVGATMGYVYIRSEYPHADAPARPQRPRSSSTLAAISLELIHGDQCTRRPLIRSTRPPRSPLHASRPSSTPIQVARRQLRAHHHGRRENQIPIALAAQPTPNLPRLRALALFGSKTCTEAGIPRRLGERSKRPLAALQDRPYERAEARVSGLRLKA